MPITKQPEREPLRHRIARSADLAGRNLHAASGPVGFGAVLSGTLGPVDAASCVGRNVLLATRDHATTGALLIELDGSAARLVLCPGDVGPDEVVSILGRAEIDVVVSDRDELAAVAGSARLVRPSWPPNQDGPAPADDAPAIGRDTEWVLTTSGTTGAPKLVAHGLDGLLSPLAVTAARLSVPPVWATFYDIRRYGGLQMFFRGVLGAGSLAIPGPAEPLPAFLDRLAPLGVTHLAGTPSHWRRALTSPALKALRPAYVRLSGEIADAAVLAALRTAFPDAIVGHAYATTEAGVAFEVNDGREGFPAGFLGRTPAGVEVKIEDGTLRIRSDRVARRMLGEAEPIAGPDGFVDTGDAVTPAGDRYLFAGRRNGMINVGGQKVYPEEVEAVLNMHPAIRMALVEGRRSPITGALVTARVVPAAPADPDALKRDVLAFCRARLPAHKVPALLQVVDAIAVGDAGKLLRGRHA